MSSTWRPATRRRYEKDYGRDYAKPKGFARIIGLLYHVLPKIGPFRALAFKVPTPEAEQLFLQSFERTRERYALELGAVRTGRIALANINFDVGEVTPKGQYRLADETYEELIKKLGQRKTGSVSAGLRGDLAGHFGANDPRVAALKP